MAFSPGSAGVLLATLSDPAELADQIKLPVSDLPETVRRLRRPRREPRRP
jgi:hypothetical protein